MRLIIFKLILLLGVVQQANSQQTVQFLSAFKDEVQLEQMSDSLQVPLLVVRGNVYALDAACFPRKLGGDQNKRKSDGETNERRMGGDENVRKQGDDQNARALGGDQNSRKADGDKNERKLAGDQNSRAIADDSNKRGLAGENDNFLCSRDGDGNVVIYFVNSKVDKSAALYYQRRYYSIQDKFLTLKSYGN